MNLKDSVPKPKQFGTDFDGFTITQFTVLGVDIYLYINRLTH